VGGKKKRKKKDDVQKSAKIDDAPKRKRPDKEWYENRLLELQVELNHMQDWVVEKGLRVVVVFEGRDAAGKGGIIKRIKERVSPRVFRVVALPAPSDRQKTQWYFQRYVEHLPAAGEIVLFDRSWYNRAGVEKVMGFCSEEEYLRFFRVCPGFERALVEDGIILIKYWLEVGKEEQRKRFQDRIDDPTKQWKLSPMDIESMKRWFDYSRARDTMLSLTDSEWAPWYLVDSNDKRRARLNCISHLLDAVHYDELPFEKPKLPDRDPPEGYEEPVRAYRWVPDVCDD
jgi:polyphosphate kinase 2